jgi:hypothetical protein
VIDLRASTPEAVAGKMSAMQIVKKHTFDAPIADCWKMFSDPKAHVAKFEGMGHHGVTVVDKKKTKKNLNLTVTREVDVDGVPGFAKKFIKPRNTVVSIDDWNDFGDGTYGGTFTLDTQGVPVDIKGQTQLEANGADRSDYTVTIDIKVNVPLIGGKLENFSKGIVNAQMDEEFRLGDAWLSEH